jgi:hypothetical protein
LLRPAAELASRIASGDEVSEITGLAREQWRVVARAFPALGRDPAPRVIRARRRREFLIGRALASFRHDALWTGSPGGGPTLFVTAHVGDARALRYLLRRHIPVASVRAPWESRTKAAHDDAVFDRRWPNEFPHVLSAAGPHALRTALRYGSLIVTADVPVRDGVEVPLLGGRVQLDPRPFRLARLARVPCRPAFLTAPGGRLTVTLEDSLPASQETALEEFGRTLARVAAAAPFEIDGRTRWGQLR